MARQPDAGQTAPRLFGVEDWSPLELGAESQVITDTGQQRHLLTCPTKLVSQLGLLYAVEPEGDRYYVFIDIRPSDDDSELRLSTLVRS